MDGNGRWAQEHHLNRVVGHRKGADAVREIVTACRELGVKFLTLYAFSEENWKRPKPEITALMTLLRKFLVSERKLLMDNGVRLLTIGDIDKLPARARETLEETLKLTAGNREMNLVLALSYGGREEIVRAVVQIAKKVKAGKLDPSDISAPVISCHLDTVGIPDPDLLIRTSGEVRTSNFLPWQSIYSELYLTPTLWPDFSRDELIKAIKEYGERERRFGLTSEQLPQKKPA